MTLAEIGLLALTGVVYAVALPQRWRGGFLLLLTTVGVFWLQPALPVRWLDYSLPLALLVLAGFTWLATRAPDQRISRRDWAAAVLVYGAALALTAARYLQLPVELTTRPPETASVALALLAALGLAAVSARLPRAGVLWAMLAVLIGLFVLLKTPALTTMLARTLRVNAGQDPALAAPVNILWLGFSYAAFRLIATVRDRQSGLLPAMTLREYITYALFLPAFPSGPIDRPETFLPQLQALPALNTREAQRFAYAGTRLAVGAFKKFVIADTLALYSLNAATAQQAGTPGALWILALIYAFQIYFDFSGAIDMVIGIGVLFGIQLPENFNRPYLQRTITAFWQSWHITLSAWARAYVYSPLSRSLLRRKRKPSPDVIFMLATLATMVVIGLWHAVALNFLIWGVWNAAGLIIHRFWTQRTRSWYRGLTPTRLRLWHGAGVAMTFLYVALGWVWFAIPDAALAAQTFLRLFGVQL
ncbi:MAG TPA: MBOAT family O-acyltransferase [Candidatus Limnocylindrales bacterium]|nr:MBOAT family O-acyltransferase [Candidatus Limnocylindrales bacterium]